MFKKKYAMAALQYTDAVFLDIVGDETKATRQMMINWCAAWLACFWFLWSLLLAVVPGPRLSFSSFRFACGGGRP